MLAARIRASTTYGVELRAGGLADEAEGLFLLHALAVGAVGEHGVQRIGHGQDAGVAGDVLALELVGIAGAVIALVVMAHHVDDVRVELDLRGDVGADDGVGLDMLALLGRELAGLEQHRIADADLAHVVQKRAALQCVDVAAARCPSRGRSSSRIRSRALA